ncbi:hypothetical protein L1987_40119 [Smallanthus sonchifolius]|uniref:Uncharacterized protein n=1 Tax=Smallanthus sonchifolius TaxID=185202 RepID=A0ACB9GTN3_9ASTR|nr:hypothetical protein L1987_40119 [Smallanthus sonchifolius]
MKAEGDEHGLDDVVATMMAMKVKLNGDDNQAENCLQVDGAAQSMLWLRLAGLGKRVEGLGQSWGREWFVNKQNIEELEVVKEKKHTDCVAWQGL